MSFATAMKQYKKTWNGAPTLSNPDPQKVSSGRIALFYRSVRGLNAPRLFECLKNSAQESVIDTFLLVFHIRDCREGKGERSLGRLAFRWLFVNYSDEFMKVFSLIPEYGRWDDLLDLWPGVLDLTQTLDIINANWYCNLQENDLIKLQSLQHNIVQFYANKLTEDIKSMDLCKNVSLAAKWAPTEKDSIDFKFKTVNLLCKNLRISPKIYRKSITTPLREYLRVVEKFMCTNKWDSIDFNKVPSCAMKRLKNAFEKHSKQSFEEWKYKLYKGEAKVNATQLFPYEIVKEIRSGKYDSVSEEQWKVLEQKTSNLGFLENGVCVTDVSGSMNYGNSTVKPIDVAISLSLIIANANKGAFHNNVISFHETPTFFVIKEGTIESKVKQILSAPWGMTTNLMDVFNMILNVAEQNNLSQEEMPKNIFIFSDMQFNNTSTGKTNYQEIEKKYQKSNYKRPNIIFWNVNGTSTDYPVSTDCNGTCLISGFSSNLVKAILEGKSINVNDIMRRTIDDERYKPVYDSLK
mgnify:CR=1 FL=1|jgi:hypothetical protein|uniref:TROVE domain-containing protein n=1 Tax=viral metagenome TaxID=1070528 RepID=A0A6C0J4H5_9ZZZZ